MAKYISVLDVSTNYEQEEELLKQGFHKIDVDLNTGAQAANKVFLWYKKGYIPITRVQVTFNEEMGVGLNKLNYIKIEKNLNIGTKGKEIFIWYSQAMGSHDLPIMDVNVSTDANTEASFLTAAGLWEEVSCNLNLGNDGKIVYAWLKRERPFYISEVTATNSYDKDKELLSKGYARVDVDTNMGAAGGAEVFIWYRKTDDESNSLGNLHISTNDEETEKLKTEGFDNVNVNLNENTTGPEVNLWHKNDFMKKVRNLVLLQDKNAVCVYKRYGINVIERSLNTGNRGDLLFTCFYA